MIDYNNASESYDNTRNASEQLVELFHKTIHFCPATTVLDFGCGTGNYLNLIQTIYGCQCYGIEPSIGMRVRAKDKNSKLIVEKGDHSQTPFPDDFFDFVYMTDVIHHVPDLGQMFAGLKRVLKSKGILCIVTQSHNQIDSRFFNRYFPSVGTIEKQRYPDILDIIEKGKIAGLQWTKTEIKQYPRTSTITASLVRTVEEKNFSMFRLLDDEEHATGLARMKNDLGEVYETAGAGDSLIWLESKL